MKAALTGAIWELAEGIGCDPRPFSGFVDLAVAGTSDAGPGFDLLVPGSAIGLNVFDRGSGAPTVLPVLSEWSRRTLGSGFLASGALDGLRVHGGPAWSGSWRCKLYASGDVRPVWARLHTEHGLGIAEPPEGTYALGLDLTEDGPRRLRSYRRVSSVPPESGLPALPLLHELGVAHRVWCETRPGPADPETRAKGSLSWIFGPRVPVARLLEVGRALPVEVGIGDLAAPSSRIEERGGEAYAVAWEIDVWAGGERGTDGLITIGSR